MIIKKIKNFFNLVLFGVIMMIYFEGILLIVLMMFLSDILCLKSLTVRKYFKRIWIHLTMTALSVYFPKPIFVCYNEKIMDHSRNIIISNHLSEYDWLIILAVLYKCKRFDNICILMKQTLRNIPLLGYGMDYYGFIFLNRKIDKDKEIIKRGMKSLKSNKEYDLLLFPEGTYIDAEGKEKSDKYIEEHEEVLKCAKFRPTEVLLPRLTGFDLIRNELDTNCEGVIDITLLINPYTTKPQDQYTYSKILTDFEDRPGFMLFIDHIPDYSAKYFLFDRFKQKNEVIKRYKKLETPISYLEDFKRESEYLKPNIGGYKFDTVYLKSDYAASIIAGLILIDGAFIYLLYNLYSRFREWN